MRLVCPNCGAQYEVPAEAIPAGGRDVQCSACGHTWFEGAPPGAGADARAEAGSAVAAEAAADLAWSEPEGVPRVEEDEEERDDLAELAWEPTPRPRSGGPAPEAGDDAPVGLAVGLSAGSSAGSSAATFGEAPDDRAFGAAPAPQAVRSTVTPEIAEILREEAEREARARAEEASRAGAERPARADAAVVAPADGPGAEPPEPEALRRAPEPEAEPVPEPAWELPPAWEPEPAAPRAPAADPGPPDRERQRAEEARRRMARLRGEPSPAAPAPARRDRLPDIEEIDTSLRGRRPPAAATATAASSARGFRRGFGGALLAAALLALVYAFAPRITAAVPALAPVVAPYARAIDRGRLWLDARMRAMVEDLGGTNATPPSSTAPASEAPEVQAEPPAAPGPGPAASGG